MDMLCLLFVCNLWVPLGIYGNLWEFLPVGGYLWEGLDWLGGPVYTFYSLLCLLNLNPDLINRQASQTYK